MCYSAIIIVSFMYYEITLLLKEDEKGIPALWDSLVKDIEKHDALIEKRALPVMKSLAYPIGHGGSWVSHVYMATMYLKPQKEASVFLEVLKEILTNNEQVVRSMITKVSRLPEERSVRPQKSVSRQRARTPLDAKTAQSLRAEELNKEEKPSLEQLDKKLEEILDDKIGF